MRIIGGDWRGRRLPVVDQPGLRPTSDRVRETLFNWLGPLLPGARVLDAFAGSGVLGFEALSRGAASAVLLERNPRLVRALEESRATLGALEARVERADAPQWLARSSQVFDIVFLDPPFDRPDLLEASLTVLLERGLLDDRGRVYIETAADREWPPAPGFDRLKKSRAGDVAFALLAPAVPGAGETAC